MFKNWKRLDQKFEYSWKPDSEYNHYYIGFFARIFKTKEIAYYQKQVGIPLICSDLMSLSKSVWRYYKKGLQEFEILEITVGEIMYGMAKNKSFAFDVVAYKRFEQYARKIQGRRTSLPRKPEVLKSGFILHKFRPALDFVYNTKLSSQDKKRL